LKDSCLQISVSKYGSLGGYMLSTTFALLCIAIVAAEILCVFVLEKELSAAVRWGGLAVAYVFFYISIKLKEKGK